MCLLNGLPRWLSFEESTCQEGDMGSIPGGIPHREDQGFPHQEDSLEKEMVTPSSILAWEIPWTEEPGGLQSRGWKRVWHDLATKQQPCHLRWCHNVITCVIRKLGQLIKSIIHYKQILDCPFLKTLEEDFFFPPEPLTRVRNNQYNDLKTPIGKEHAS